MNRIKTWFGYSCFGFYPVNPVRPVQIVFNGVLPAPTDITAGDLPVSDLPAQMRLIALLIAYFKRGAEFAMRCPQRGSCGEE